MSIEQVGSTQHEATCTCGSKLYGATHDKARALITRHCADKNAKRCTTPDKPAYPTQEEAVAALRRAQKWIGGGKLPRHTYLCRCGSWHLTTRGH